MVKLKAILSEKPMYGASEEGIARQNKNQIRYIRITDIDEYGLLINDLGVTCKNIESKYFLSNSDILIARSGNTVGKSYIHDTNIIKEACLFAGYLIRFRVNYNLALPYYIFYYLQLPFFNKWKNAIMRLAGQPNINAQEYQDMVIPLPLKKIQQQIINIMDNAYAVKQQKQKEASKLLASINDYLLDELGIIMPKVEENSLESRISYVNSADVISGRFDPKNYTAKYKNIFFAIKSAPYDKKILRQVIKYDIAGSWGVDETVEDESLVKCLTIRATEFDNRYNLRLDNGRVKYRKYTSSTYEKMDIEIGDILIEKSGGSEDQPVGRVAIIDKESIENNRLAFSNFIHKIVANDEFVRSDYLFEYLTLMHNIKVTEVMQNQTNGIRNLIMGEYFGQIVLLPDKNKQEEIALHIQQIREKAKQLEQEAINVLDNAKAQVEKILLGED